MARRVFKDFSAYNAISHRFGCKHIATELQGLGQGDIHSVVFEPHDIRTPVAIHISQGANMILVFPTL